MAPASGSRPTGATGRWCSNRRLLGSTAAGGGLAELAVPAEFQIPDLGSPRISRFAVLARDLAGAVAGDDIDPAYATFDDGVRIKEIAAEVL